MIILKNGLTLPTSFLISGDSIEVLKHLPSESVQCAITSPPYWGQRDYRTTGQIGLEDFLDEFVERLVSVFSEVKRILKKRGTLWVVIGDGYTSGNRKYRAADRKYPKREMRKRPDTPEGLKKKDLIGVPWKLAFALQRTGWFLRSETIWHKPNAMPESVMDRPWRNHENIFLFSKSERYFFDQSKLNGQGGFNRRSVWSLNTRSNGVKHNASFPVQLVEPMMGSSSRRGDWILDPFFGSGTVGIVCQAMHRRFVGVEINKNYIKICQRRLSKGIPVLKLGLNHTV